MRSTLAYGALVPLGVGAITVTMVEFGLVQKSWSSDYPGIQIDADDIGGIVIGPNGPEAGVWVIAETNDLPTYFVRSVITDEEGRYVIPDLPAANYQVWSRGYGLLDSPKANSSLAFITTKAGLVIRPYSRKSL